MTDLDRLKRHLEAMGPVAVAVSGGVDSMTLAVVAHRINGQGEYFHALSAAVPYQATQRVKKYAEKEGWNLSLINAGETDDPDYIANPADRCYYCKTHLYDSIGHHTRLTIVSGTNTDDLGDYRPGLVAASEHKVVHPYVEVGISKDQLRKIARHLELDDLHDLPAAPCLSSRVTTGIPISKALLPVINAAEQLLWEQLQHEIPIKGVRCRIRPGQVAVEIDTQEAVGNDANYAPRVDRIVRKLFTDNGFADYCGQISIEPYRRGSAFLIDTLEVS